MRVAVACPGLGRVNRGFERFAKELGEQLREDLEIDTFGADATRLEHVKKIHTLHRDSKLWQLPGFRNRSGYDWEALSFTASLVPTLHTGTYQIVHVVDPPVMNFLHRFRSISRGTWRILFTNGVGLSADLCERADHTHHVSPHAYKMAREYGTSPERLTMLPHAIDTQALDIPETKSMARSRLGLPVDAFIALQVSSVNRDHKRTDYAIREVAKTDHAVLLVVGRSADRSVLDMGRQVLGSRFIHRELTFEEMPLVYRSADVFVHTALFEGFGLSVVEAMAASVPVFAHRDEHFRWLLGGTEGLIPMHVPGALADALLVFIRGTARDELPRRRQRAEQYSWAALRSEYLQMYERVIRQRVTPR